MVYQVYEHNAVVELVRLKRTLPISSIRTPDLVDRAMRDMDLETEDLRPCDGIV